MLEKAGWELVRVKGSHQVSEFEDRRVVVPYHGSRVLHPKIVRQILKACDSEE